MKKTKIIIMGLIFFLLVGFTTAGILNSIEVNKEVVLDKHTIDNLKESGIGIDFIVSECVVVDDKFCKFVVNDPYFFEDYKPHLQYIEYQGKTKEQINEEMKENMEEMLKFYSDKLDYEKAYIEPIKEVVSDKIIISVKEDKEIAIK